MSTIIPEKIEAPPAGPTVGMQVLILPHPSGKALTYTFASGAISIQAIVPLSFLPNMRELERRAIEQMEREKR